MNQLILAASVLACGLLLGCTNQVSSGQELSLQVVAPPSSDQSDEARIYQQFLNDWNEGGTQQLNVSIRADALSPEDIKDISDCAKDQSGWTPAQPNPNITSLVEKLPYVRLVDPEEWKPTDPQDLISRGKSVESAVEDGFAGGLMSLSAITFDRSHQFAAFNYSFVCGALCGSGATVIFSRTKNKWVRAMVKCGGWMSQSDGRPNNSFKPTPLRGAA